MSPFHLYRTIVAMIGRQANYFKFHISRLFINDVGWHLEVYVGKQAGTFWVFLCHLRRGAPAFVTIVLLQLLSKKMSALFLDSRIIWWSQTLHCSCPWGNLSVFFDSNTNGIALIQPLELPVGQIKRSLILSNGVARVLFTELPIQPFFLLSFWLTQVSSRK